MGLTDADIEVENLFSNRRMAIRALVNSGTVFMIIPEHIAVQLGSTPLFAVVIRLPLPGRDVALCLEPAKVAGESGVSIIRNVQTACHSSAALLLSGISR